VEKNERRPITTYNSMNFYVAGAQHLVPKVV
jgi:hypothetical protein